MMELKQFLQNAANVKPSQRQLDWFDGACGEGPNGKSRSTISRATSRRSADISRTQ